MLKKNLANIITCVRILGTVGLLLLEPVSVWWLVVYAVCGISDVADGTVARHFHITSRIGARLDTAADFFEYTVMLLQLLPILVQRVPGFFWYFVAFVCLLRAGYYLYYFVRTRTLAATHAILNKMTSFMIFLVPYVMNSRLLTGYGFLLVGVALAAAMQDWMHCLPEKWQRRVPGKKPHE